MLLICVMLDNLDVFLVCRHILSSLALASHNAKRMIIIAKYLTSYSHRNTVYKVT